MRIVADTARCEGHGVCVNQAPGLLDLDDDDMVVVLETGTDFDTAALSDAQRAVESCPVAALRIGSE